jgi:transposase-like protein
MNEDNTKELGQVIRIDDERVQNYLRNAVRGSVEETLNAMLEAEAEHLYNAGRYERTKARRDTRAGSHIRKLQTQPGQVTLKVPKLRLQTFETAIIERYPRRESSVEEALIEMYLAGVSVRRVEGITVALWGARVSPSTGSNFNKKIYASIEAWRMRPIEDEDPYLYLDGIVLKRSWREERIAVGGDIGQQRGLSRDSWHLRGRQGGWRELVGIPQTAQAARSRGSTADRFRCLTSA